jgi:hypothetical protein
MKLLIAIFPASACYFSLKGEEVDNSRGTQENVKKNKYFIFEGKLCVIFYS